MKATGLLLLSTLMVCHSCQQMPQADGIFYNGRIYTVDSAFSIVQAMAIRDGRILAVGNNDLRKRFSGKEVNLHGAALYPGFIDSHCHFYGYATSLAQCDLTGTRSFDEVIQRVKAFALHNRFEWILGRGWDQNDWPRKEFPDRSLLDSLFPDVPVFLLRIDGHAALVNQKVLQMAGFHRHTHIDGGELLVHQGRLTGILIDNAVDSVSKLIPEYSPSLMAGWLHQAQQNCFQVGLTTVVDAGLELKTILLIDSLQRAGRLDLSVYAMASWNEENRNYFFQKGKIKTAGLHVESFKLYADGALGSRGACLLEPYSDRPAHHGFLLQPAEALQAAAQEIYRHGFQMNTHCIGDSANRLMLQIYAAVLKGKNDRRWRIEHCQTVHPDDMAMFGQYSIIPSVQPTHATSDMYWAEARLGSQRIKTAYAYRQLLESAELLALGSDFPVESINPLLGFYAAIERKDLKGFPPGGFQKENAIRRQQALQGMTRWAAYSIFEEQEKGSLEPGKRADFVVLDKDIMTCAAEEIPAVKVLQTWVGGRQVY
jgi:predicted amidohydrolase YtcJ